MIAHPGPERVGGPIVDVAISPDGRRVIYLASEGGPGRIYERALDTLSPTRLGNLENVTTVFPSPDGQWVGFADGTDRSLKKIPISGGPPFTIGRLPPNIGPYGCDMGTERYDHPRHQQSGLWRVAAGGGTLEPLTKPDPQKGEQSHRLPQILPGGRAALFALLPPGNQGDDAQIAVLDLATGTVKVIIQGGTTRSTQPLVISSMPALALCAPWRSTLIGLKSAETP